MVGDLSTCCSQIVIEMPVFGAHRQTRCSVWSVNKLARAVTKWTRTCNRRLPRSVSRVDKTSDFRQKRHVAHTAQQSRLGVSQDADFAGDLEDSKSVDGWNLLHVQSGKCRRNMKNTAPIVWLQIRCANPLFPSYLQCRLREQARIRIPWAPRDLRRVSGVPTLLAREPRRANVENGWRVRHSMRQGGSGHCRRSGTQLFSDSRMSKWHSYIRVLSCCAAVLVKVVLPFPVLGEVCCACVPSVLEFWSYGCLSQDVVKTYHRMIILIRERISNSKRMSPGTSYNNWGYLKACRTDSRSTKQFREYSWIPACGPQYLLHEEKDLIQRVLRNMYVVEIQKILITIQNQLLSPHQEERFGLYGQLIWPWKKCILLHTYWRQRRMSFRSLCCLLVGRCPPYPSSWRIWEQDRITDFVSLPEYRELYSSDGEPSVYERKTIN